MECLQGALMRAGSCLATPSSSISPDDALKNSKGEQLGGEG